jgi:hypothetical protein
VDRNNYAPASYDVWIAITDYAQSYAGPSGSVSCPPPSPDGGWGGGCQFTRQ